MEKVEDSFLNEYLCGLCPLDTHEFYNLYDKLKQNHIIPPIYLYSASLVDVYEFDDNLDSWPYIKIFNQTKNTCVKFNLKKYLADALFKNVYDYDVLSAKYFKLSRRDENRKVQVFFTKKGEQTLYENLYKNTKEDKKELFELTTNDINLFINYVINYINKSILKNYKTDFSKLYSINISDLENDTSIYKTKYVNCEQIKKYFYSLLSKSIGSKNIFKNELLKKITDIFKTKNQKEEVINILKREKFFDVVLKLLFEHKSYILNREMYLKNFIKTRTGVKVAEFHVWDVIGNKRLSKYNTKNTSLDLEIKYVGQSYGKNGNRSVFDRIGNGHEHIQKIIAQKPRNQDLLLLFFVLNSKGYIGGKLLNSRRQLRAFLTNVVHKKYSSIDKNQHINLAEMALITFFKPSENIDFMKQDFEKIDKKSIGQILKDFDGIIVELDCGNYNMTISSNERKGKNKFVSSKRYIRCRFEDKNFKLFKLLKKEYRDVK